MTKIIIHNHLPRTTRDHWFKEGRVGQYDILQGAGVDGGDWMARGRGEAKRFKTRREAEEHAEASSE